MNKEVETIISKLLKLGFRHEDGTLKKNEFGIVCTPTQQESVMLRLPIHTDGNGEFEYKSRILENLGIFFQLETYTYLDVVILSEDYKENFYGWFSVFLTLEFCVMMLGKDVNLSQSVKLPFNKYSELKRFVKFMQSRQGVKLW